MKLYRTEALARLDVVANARLKTRFRQFRVRALALSTGVLTAFDHTRALSQLCEWVANEAALLIIPESAGRRAGEGRRQGPRPRDRIGTKGAV